MSIHGACFDNGESGRCNIDDCEVFNYGGCQNPGEILDYAEDDAGNENDFFIDYETIYELYPQLKGEANKPTKEIVMENKLETGLKVQETDRVGAANKLHGLVIGLTKVDKKTDFFSEGCVEVFNEVIHVPVKVVCLENAGVRRVFVNAFEADPSTMKTIVSKEIIECFDRLSVKINDLDAELGCENLNSLASKVV